MSLSGNNVLVFYISARVFPGTGFHNFEYENQSAGCHLSPAFFKFAAFLCFITVTDKKMNLFEVSDSWSTGSENL